MTETAELREKYQGLLRCISGHESARRCRNPWRVVTESNYVLMVDESLLAKKETALSNPQRRQVVQIYENYLRAARRHGVQEREKNLKWITGGRIPSRSRQKGNRAATTKRTKRRAIK